jgi:hypothetical protein
LTACAIVTRFLSNYSAECLAEVKTSVTDNSYSFDCDVVPGNGDVVHDGWIHPHPSGISDGIGLDTSDTRSPDRLMAYQLPVLRYSYDALEPCIDTETMRLRHMTIEDLLEHLNEVAEEIRNTVRNSGVGHANTKLLWKVIGPPNGATPRERLPRQSGTISFENLQAKLTEAATMVFGSGWAFPATSFVLSSGGYSSIISHRSSRKLLSVCQRNLSSLPSMPATPKWAEQACRVRIALLTDVVLQD